MQPALLAVAPTRFVTLQDLGRVGWQRFGVSRCGAMDVEALAIANALVGNAPDMAALEFAHAGGEWELGATSCRVAVTGGRFAVFVDAGVLWNQIGPSPLRITPGAGLRYTSPIGPIRVDAGYNTYPLQAGQLFKISTDGTLSQIQGAFVKPRSGSWTWHFSIGQAF